MRSKGRCWPLKLLAEFDFPDDYHTLFAACKKELNFVIPGRLFFKNCQYFFNWQGAFKNRDKFFFPVVKSKKGQVMDRKKTGQEIMSILCHNNILVVSQPVTFPEGHHAIKRCIRSHDDLYMPEFINVLNDRLRLLLAVFALRVKQ